MQSRQNKGTQTKIIEILLEGQHIRFGQFKHYYARFISTDRSLTTKDA